MAFYAVYVRDQAIHQVARERNKPHVFLIEAAAKQAWASHSSASSGSAECDRCGHRHSSVCEECSLARQYSDYGICHCCRELNPRVPNLYLKGGV